MAYADVKARLVVHVQTAAAAVTPPVEDAQAGFPLPKERCARVWYGGETEPRRMGGTLTLNSELVGKVTMIGLFLPVTALDEELSRALDAQGEAFSHALRTAIDGDTGLATAGDNTTLEYGTPELIIVGNARFLAFLWSAVTDYVEYTIAK